MAEYSTQQDADLFVHWQQCVRIDDYGSLESTRTVAANICGLDGR